MAGYYCLVASLNEYSLSGDSKQMDFLSIREDISEQLTKKDRKLFELLLSYWDIQNFLNVIDGRANQYTIIGNYSQEQIAELALWYSDILELNSVPEEQQKQDEPKEYAILLNEVFSEVFKSLENPDYAEKKGIDITTPIAKRLFECYYLKFEKSGNKFLKKWGEFDRSVKNLAAAYEARKLSLPIDSIIVGKGIVCKSIVENIKDESFGLTELEWVADVLKLLSSKDIIKKERGLDLLRWNYIDELSTFEYFSIDFVMGYMLKITMICRWLQLDESTGREMFDRLVQNVTTPELIDVE